ncbi:hypothetical protein H6F93_20635 [Leptolyngbya sp. FACHB-671]|nr:hypothetical protein [Leptolyngbya sp. FACHB-671]MBD2069892.1 hypothetical protein [Leptolyngbya sp. FACHB-671]
MNLKQILRLETEFPGAKFIRTYLTAVATLAASVLGIKQQENYSLP